MAALVKEVLLKIVASDADAKLKIDAIAAKAEELKAEHPELVMRINTAEASAKLAVLRDQLKATGVAAAEAGTEASVAGDKMGAAGTKAAAGGAMMEKAWKATRLVMLGVGGALAYGIVKAASFQQEMERIHTQAGVAQSSLKGLGTGVLQLAGQVGESPNSLAESLYHVASNMASLGVSGPKMLDAVKVAAEGARVGGADLVDVTNALGAVIASGIPGVNNYSHAMGMLNATVGAGDMTMQNLVEAIGTGFLPVAHLYGTTLNDMGAIMATFGDSLIRGSHAGTLLRMAIQSIAVQAKTAGPYLDKLGIKGGELYHIQSQHGTVAAINFFVDRLKASKIPVSEWGQFVTQIFTKKAGAGIGVLVEQLDRLNSKTHQLEGLAGKFGGAWAAQGKTVQQQFADLKYGSEALVTTLGQALLPAALKVTTWLSHFVQDLQKGTAGARTLASVIGLVLAGIALKKLEEGLAGAVKGFVTLGKAVLAAPAVIGKVASALSSAAAASGRFVATMVANTVKAIAATAVWIARQAVAAATFIAENVAMAASATAAFIAENAATLGLIAGIAALVAGIIYLALHWKRVWHDIKAWTLDAVRYIVESWKQLWSQAKALVNGLRGAWDQAVRDVEHWANDVRGFIDRIVGWFERLPGRVLHAIGSLAGMLFSAGVHVVEGFIHGVESMFGSVASAAWNMVKSLGSTVAHFLGIGSPSKVAHWWGEMVGEGMALGIESKATRVGQASLRLTTSAISGAAAGGGYGRGSGAALQIEWVGGGSDQEIFTYLKKHIRIRGGDPSVLGR